MMEERKVPALRFQGLADKWEQVKLGNLAIFNPKVNLPDTFEYVDLESVVGTEMISHRKESKKTAPSRAQRLASKGDLFYQNVRPYQKNNYLFELQDKNYVFSTGYTQLRPRIDNRFLLSLVQSDGFVRDVLSTCTGTSYPAVNSNALAEIEVYYPINANEQKKVGEYFSLLDRLIIRYKHQLYKLQVFKKSMLEKMFPRPCEKVPEVRFRGFTGDWEKKKLGSIFEEYSEKNHAELPPLMIVQGGGTILRDESDRSLQYDRSNLSSYKMVNKDDFIVHLRSFEGGLEKASSQGIISPAYNTFHGEGIDARFYYAYFRSAVFIRHDLKPHVYGIRDGRSIDIEGMKSILIPYTSYEEQKKIGDCISLLDQLIMLCQRKLEKLQSLKQAMLSEMFI